MSKGVKKIKWNSSEPGGAGVYSKLSMPNKLLTIEPDKFAWFSVSEWYPDTTKAEKEKNITWIRQDRQEKTILKQMTIPNNQLYGFKLERKLCGPFTYYIEASLSGKRDLKNETGLYVRGYCSPKIVDTKWCTSNDGKDERSRLFSYGEKLYLGVNTEGLNGNIVTVEVFRYKEGSYFTGKKEDQKLRIISNVKVIDGEINLEINNTSLWRGTINDIQETEKFYIKIKDAFGNYIKDAKGDVIHARFLRIKNKSVPQVPEKPTNNTPVKVGETTVKTNRYELCKFEEISISETETKDGKASTSTVKVFDNGKGLKSTKGTTEKVTTSIYFKFDVDVVDDKSKQALQNVLNFLLEHPHSGIRLEGYACVIGKQNYNNGLSQRRSDAVKKFFLDGGLKADRILSLGKGEVNATDNKQGRDNIKYKDEKEYIDNRRVDVSFTFEGHNAQTIVYETIAPSSDKNILLEVKGFETKSCFKTKDKHTKKIKVTSSAYPVAKVQNGDKMQIPVRSTLERLNLAPVNYLWPRYNALILSESANPYHIYVHSCRYFSNEKNSVIKIKVFPDIKWNLQLSFNWEHPFAYTHSNLPEYSRSNPKDPKVAQIIREERKAQSKSVGAGKESTRVANSSQMLTKFELKLTAKWDEGKQNLEIGVELAKKIRDVLNIFIKYKEIADKVKNTLGGAVKKSPLKPPFMFEVLSPSLNANIDWYLERGSGKYINQVATVGKLNFKADPLIGAEFVIDLLAVGSRLHPVIAAMVVGTELALSALNGGIIFEAKFYGKLEFDFNAIEINSFTGIVKGGVLDLGAKLGIQINLKINFAVKKKTWIMEVEVKLRLECKADAYFAAKIKVDSDEKGVFWKPEIGFSGLILTFEVEIVVGGFKRMLKLDNEGEPFLKADIPNLPKKYLIDSKPSVSGGGGF